MAHRKPLALIAVGVIAAHVVLLQSVGLQLQPPDPLSVKALITRTLVTPEAAPAVAEAPPAPAATTMAIAASVFFFIQVPYRACRRLYQSSGAMRSISMTAACHGVGASLIFQDSTRAA